MSPGLAAAQGSSLQTGPHCHRAPTPLAEGPSRPRAGFSAPAVESSGSHPTGAQTLLGSSEYCSSVWGPGLLTGCWGGHESTGGPGLRSNGAEAVRKDAPTASTAQAQSSPQRPADVTLTPPHARPAGGTARRTLTHTWTPARGRQMGHRTLWGNWDHRMKTLQGEVEVKCAPRGGWKKQTGAYKEGDLFTRLRSTEHITERCSRVTYVRVESYF